MKYLIAVPCMDMVHTEFLRSILQLRKVDECKYVLSQSSLIYDARNTLAKRAVTDGFDRILWLDSDMSFEADLMERLAARMDEGKEMVTGLYFTRKAPIRPVLYKECGYFETDDGIKPLALWFDEYPRDDIFKVQGCGFGAVMMSTDLIRKVAEKFGMPFAPMLGFGEDLSFCARVTEAGSEIWADSTIKLGHVGLGTITESVFLSQGGHNGDPERSPNGVENNDKRL